MTIGISRVPVDRWQEGALISRWVLFYTPAVLINFATYSCKVEPLGRNAVGVEGRAAPLPCISAAPVFAPSRATAQV